MTGLVFEPAHALAFAGHIPELPGGRRRVRHMAAVGPLARSVEDLRLCLSLVEGADDRNWEVPPPPALRPNLVRSDEGSPGVVAARRERRNRLKVSQDR